MKDFDKTKCMYFVIKDEKNFDKYMEIWENISNIMKNSNIEFICNKRYLNVEEIFTKRESFQCFLYQ